MIKRKPLLRALYVCWPTVFNPFGSELISMFHFEVSPFQIPVITATTDSYVKCLFLRLEDITTFKMILNLIQ